MIEPRRLPRVTMLDPNANTPPYDRALCGALAAAGCDVELVTAPFLYESLPLPRGYRLRHGFFRLLAGPVGRGALSERPAVRRLLKAAEYPANWAAFLVQIERRRPDVLHVQWSLNPALDLAAWRWLRWRGVPIVYTAHNLLPHAERSGDVDRYGRLYHLADRVIVHSSRSAAELAERFRLPPSRIAVVPHGPLLEDEPALGRAAARERLGLPPAAPLVLFTGLIEPYKGLGDLVEAFAVLAKTDAIVRLVVAGRPNESIERYRVSLRSHGLLDRVRLDLRYLPRAELAAYLCAADVVALPYRRATTSGLLLAAWRFGRPVVTTRVGDLAELVVDGESGLLVPPRDSAALAGALARVLADRPLAERLGDGGRRRADEGSWNLAARRTIEVYWNLIAARAGGQARG